MRELCGAYERSGALSSHARYAAEHLARLRCCQVRGSAPSLCTPDATVLHARAHVRRLAAQAGTVTLSTRACGCAARTLPGALQAL